MIHHITNIASLVTNNNIIQNNLIINIENYLGNSVQLKSQVTYIFNGHIHTEPEITQKVEEISRIKNLPSLTFKTKLKSIFMKSNKITKYKKDLITLYEEKIDKNNIQHMNMLYDIWLRFNRYDRNIMPIDKKWSKYIKNNIFLFIIANIGFQGNDPLRDFRGSGLLGLRHLWYFSLNDSRADRVFQVATGEKTWYYYAAGGINISGIVIRFIEGKDCDNFFYDNNNTIDLYNFSQCLYNEFFVGFNDMWIQKGHFDIMRFNSTLEEFMEYRAKLIFQRLIQMKKVF